MNPEEQQLILMAIARAGAERDSFGSVTPKALAVIQDLKRMLTDPRLRQDIFSKLGDSSASVGLPQEAGSVSVL